ncbi:hypothetical protein GWI33_007756 [Rhynchophorus ferrugineus]|uniref:Uncharacterized protein n=1 Tax=Rhynchophorus ferrugineus TaxID=354439 RepID=A0A834MJF2_RHYFE|nr:hypothetical protein GWI33_007756 [Rhynchophorus ferrugineus]
MPVFAVTNANDEILQYQMGRIHPTVVHLAVHLENGLEEKSREFQIVEELNAAIQNFLSGQLVSFKLVDTVMNVAYSRVGKLSSLFIYAPQNKTKNIVYQKALN